MMEITIEPASLSEKPILQRLMELYLYDFSEFDGADLDQQGIYGYEYLDHYWVEAGRAPFITRVDGRLAGFVLALDYSVTGSQGKMIGEFFVMRKYRRQGVGKAAAFHVFDSFPGHWEVSQIAENRTATAFWRKIIAEYTRGQFEEVILDNETWLGPVQIFDNSAYAG